MLDEHGLPSWSPDRQTHVWTNDRENIDYTAQELNTITGVVDSAIAICVKRKLHAAYHALMLANEILKRRAEYLRQVSLNHFTFPSTRLTYPTHFLCEWLRFITLRKQIVPVICNQQCTLLFECLDTNKGPAADKTVHSSNATYPLGEPITCGPSEAAPNSSNSGNRQWTDVYELKYIHCAIKGAIDCLADDGPFGNVLCKLASLFLIRYKTKIGYTPGVGNNLVKDHRDWFYKALDEYNLVLV